MKTKTLLTSLCLSLSGDDNSVPEWVEVIPKGQQVIGLDGRSWINDKPQDVIAAFQELKNAGRDLVFDFEHATELKAPNGDKAPASGWGVDMQQRNNGSIWVKVDWTPEGQEAISKREYRYLSPVIIYEKSSNRIVGIKSVALTNNANLLVTALNQQLIGNTMNDDLLERLRYMLNLPTLATIDEIIAEFDKLKIVIQTDATASNSRTGLGELITAKNAEITLLKTSASNPPLDKFVPRADYDTAMNQLGTIKTELENIKKTQLQAEIDVAINAALQAGKITPATKDYHVAMCQQDGGLDRFKKFVESAPVIAGDSNMAGKPKDETQIALNAEQAKIAEIFGNSVEDLKKYGAI